MRVISARLFGSLTDHNENKEIIAIGKLSKTADKARRILFSAEQL